MAATNDKRKREDETVLESGEVQTHETKRRRVVSPSPDKKNAHEEYTKQVTENLLRKEVSDKVTGTMDDKARLHVVEIRKVSTSTSLAEAIEKVAREIRIEVGEVADEVERVLDLVGGPGREASERGQLLGLYKAPLRGP